MQFFSILVKPSTGSGIKVFYINCILLVSLVIFWIGLLTTSLRGNNVSFSRAFPQIGQLLKQACLKVQYEVPFFLAHLSRRLTGELIGYPWIRRPSVRRPSSVRPFTFSNIFSSETAWPIKAKFYVEPPWEGGTKVYINGPGHMTKMAAMPIYGKNPSKIFFSRTGGPIFTKLGM